MRSIVAWLRRLNPVHHAERRYARDRKDDRVVKRLEAVKRRSIARTDARMRTIRERVDVPGDGGTPWASR